MRHNFLKPFAQKKLNSERRIFKWMLSTARGIIQHAFGIMVVIFKIFHLAINLKLENIDKVVIACWILHNFLIKR